MNERFKSLIKPMIFVAIAIFVLCCLFVKKPEKLDDYTSYAGYAVSGVGILFLLYERFLWRFIPWNRPPVLKKKYNGLLKYKYRNQECTKPIAIEVKQTLFSVVVNTKTDINSSYSVTGNIVKEHDGVEVLYYTYYTDPTSASRRKNPIQYGTCRMVLNRNNENISGAYWTSSETIGDIEWVASDN